MTNRRFNPGDIVKLKKSFCKNENSPAIIIKYTISYQEYLIKFLDDGEIISYNMMEMGHFEKVN